jgi:hypothetical protein
LLTYESLTLGRAFPTRSFLVTPDLVADYAAITGDDDPAYCGDGGIVPPGLAGVWARLAYAQGHRLPAGGFMASQEVHLFGLAAVGGALLLSAEVAARGHPERRELTLSCEARDATGRPIGSSRIDARWGATP